MFYVEPKKDKLGRLQAVGSFEEGGRYPVVSVNSDLVGMLRFYVVDGEGEFIDIPAQEFTYVGQTKGKPGRPAKDAPA